MQVLVQEILLRYILRKNTAHQRWILWDVGLHRNMWKYWSVMLKFVKTPDWNGLYMCMQMHTITFAECNNVEIGPIPTYSWTAGLKSFFLIGSRRSHVLQNAIDDEFKIYRDIVQGDVFDAYTNLTLKAIMCLYFESTYCSHVSYCIKDDDDALAHIFVIMNMISMEEYSERFITCYNLDNQPILRSKNLNCMKLCVATEYLHPVLHWNWLCNIHFLSDKAVWAFKKRALLLDRWSVRYRFSAAKGFMEINGLNCRRNKIDTSYLRKVFCPTPISSCFTTFRVMITGWHGIRCWDNTQPAKPIHSVSLLILLSGKVLLKRKLSVHIQRNYVRAIG